MSLTFHDVISLSLKSHAFWAEMNDMPTFEPTLLVFEALLQLKTATTQSFREPADSLVFPYTGIP